MKMMLPVDVVRQDMGGDGGRRPAVETPTGCGQNINDKLWSFPGQWTLDSNVQSSLMCQIRT